MTDPTPTKTPDALSERIKRLPAEWAQGRPARRFRFMMEPMGRALVAEQERDEAEADRNAARAWSTRWKTAAQRYRSLYRKTVEINPLAASVVHRLNEMADALEQAERSRDTYRATAERHLDRLRHLEEERFDCASHRRVLTALNERLNSERAEIREAVGAQPDETTLQAVQDMLGEHRHYFRATSRAHEQTIPSLRAALQWYADPANHDRGPNVIPWITNAMIDKGERARATLLAPDRADQEAGSE